VNHAPVNGPRALADMRDVQAVREFVEREAQAAALFRAEVRAFVARTEEELRAARADRGTMLRHLSRLVDVPGERETLSPPTWQGRMATWLARPASTRAVLALAAAGVLATLSGCVALMGVHP
jgi:membrane-bound ClpP family serine protease